MPESPTPALTARISVGLWMPDSLTVSAKAVEKVDDFKAYAVDHVVSRLTRTSEDFEVQESSAGDNNPDKDLEPWYLEQNEVQVTELVTRKITLWVRQEDNGPLGVIWVGKPLAGACRPTQHGWEKTRVYPTYWRVRGAPGGPWCANDIVARYDREHTQLDSRTFEALCRIPICAYYVAAFSHAGGSITVR